MHTHYTARIRVYTVVATAILSCLTMPEASSQRTMRYQNLLTLYIQLPVSVLPGYGIHACYGRYTIEGYWKAGGGAMTQGVPLSAGRSLQLLTVKAQGDYMHRLAASRSRSVSVYAGCGAFIGYETYDPAGRLPSSIETGLGEGAFIYGLVPQVELELFFTRSIALVAAIEAPLTFSSAVHWLRAQVRGGLRINI